MSSPQPAHVQVIEMATAFWVSRAVYAAARLGLADLLADGPSSVAALASATGTHEPSLYRLMRTLAGLGFFTSDGARRFALTPMGAALRTGAPGMARPTVLAMAGDWMWQSWSEVLHGVKTGETGMKKAWGLSLFEYLAKHPEEAKHFGEAMWGFHESEPPAVAAAYDFSGIRTVVDVGGGIGHLTTAVLAANPRLRGILYDLPHVVPEARKHLKSQRMAARCDVQAGDFFESVPAGGDAYMLSRVIHDWDERRCVAVLHHCHGAMGPKGRLLLVETVLPPGDAPHPGKLLDMQMLVTAGGMERTADEYAALLAKASFRLTRVVPTSSPVSIVEAVPV